MFYLVLARRTGATLFTLDKKMWALARDMHVNCIEEVDLRFILWGLMVPILIEYLLREAAIAHRLRGLLRVIKLLLYVEIVVSIFLLRMPVEGRQ